MANSPRGRAEVKVIQAEDDEPRPRKSSLVGGQNVTTPVAPPANVDLSAIQSAEEEEKYGQRIRATLAWLFTVLLVGTSIFVGYNASFGEWLHWNALLVVVVNLWSNLSSDALRLYHPTLPLPKARWVTFGVVLLALFSGVSVYLAGIQLQRLPQYQASGWIWLAQIMTVLCGFLANIAQRELQLVLSPVADFFARRISLVAVHSRRTRASPL